MILYLIEDASLLKLQFYYTELFCLDFGRNTFVFCWIFYSFDVRSFYISLEQLE